MFAGGSRREDPIAMEFVGRRDVDCVDALIFDKERQASVVAFAILCFVAYWVARSASEPMTATTHARRWRERRRSYARPQSCSRPRAPSEVRSLLSSLLN